MTEQRQSTPEAIYSKLAAVTFEHDSDFRNHKKSGAKKIRESEDYVGTVYDEDDTEDEFDIYDTRRLELVSRYNVALNERPRRDTRMQFNLKLTTILQVPAMPPVLAAQFSDEQSQQYIGAEPGDLQEVRSLEYVVKHTIDDAVSVVRHLDYTLHNNGTPLVTVHDPVSKNAFERVAVAHEQRTIVVPPRVMQDQLTDVETQIDFGAMLLRGMRTDAERPNLSVDEYQQDAALSINALLKVLCSSAPIPSTVDKLY